MRRRAFSILCVDGDAFGLQVRRMVLESFGCKVSACTSGAEALTSLRKSKFDIIVMDYTVEGMPGEELARQIRNTQPTIPVLMLTNMVYPPESVVPYIDRFATKGEWPGALMKTIENTIRERRSRESQSARSRSWLQGVAIGGAKFLARAFDRNKHHSEGADESPEAQTVELRRHSHHGAQA